MRSTALTAIVCLLSVASPRLLRAEEPTCPATRESFRVALYETRGAYERWEWETFDSRLASARDALRCVDEALPASDLPLLFELEAFSAAMNDHPIQAMAAFRGLLQLSPTYELPLSVAPEGSLLRRAWREAQIPQLSQSSPLAPGQWFVNGESGAQRLLIGRAAVVQNVADGVQTFWYDGVSPFPEVFGGLQQDPQDVAGPRAPDEQTPTEPQPPASPQPEVLPPLEATLPPPVSPTGVAQVGVDLGSLLTLHLAVPLPPGSGPHRRRLERVGIQGGLLLPIPLSSLATADPVGTFDVPPVGLLFFFMDWNLSEKLALQSSLDLLIAGTDPCGGAGLGLRFGPRAHPLHAQLGLHVVGDCALPNPSSMLMMLPDLRLSLSL